MTSTSNRRIALIALAVLALDQFTKYLVKRCMYLEEEKVIIPGFFKLVHWGNTGAAWSLMTGKNGLLAAVAIVALIVLYRSRHHFEAHTTLGQIALGLIFGGILGNLADRLLYRKVTDFLRFYLERRGDDAIGFPAFNIADSAICIGVGLIFISTLRTDKPAAGPEAQTPVGS
jgi:signal peptidase II